MHRKSHRGRLLSSRSRRPMQSKTYVGLDIHRETVVATALTETGHRINQVTLGPSKQELARYIRDLPGTEKHVVMEACVMWEAYVDAAEECATTVTLSNPLKTRMIAEATIKTDKVDSETLATLRRIDALPKSFAPPADLRELRHLVRDRLFYRRKTTMVLNHGYAELITRGIPYETGFLKLVKGRRLARTLGVESVVRAVDTIEYLLEKTKGLDRQIHDSFEASREAQLLASIPGIGGLAAVTLVAFLSPISRFSTVDRVCSYAGLAPTTYQSGGTCFQGKLKRDSNHLIQTLLIELGWIH